MTSAAENRRPAPSDSEAILNALPNPVLLIAPDGKIVRQVTMPDEFPTNICFGGPDMRTAYVTLSATGRLGALDWAESGLKLNFG